MKLIKLLYKPYQLELQEHIRLVTITCGFRTFDTTQTQYTVFDSIGHLEKYVAQKYQMRLFTQRSPCSLIIHVVVVVVGLICFRHSIKFDYSHIV